MILRYKGRLAPIQYLKLKLYYTKSFCTYLLRYLPTSGLTFSARIRPATLRSARRHTVLHTGINYWNNGVVFVIWEGYLAKCKWTPQSPPDWQRNIPQESMSTIEDSARMNWVAYRNDKVFEWGQVRVHLVDPALQSLSVSGVELQPNHQHKRELQSR
jgi:hypothetical protein